MNLIINCIIQLIILEVKMAKEFFKIIQNDFNKEIISLDICSSNTSISGVFLLITDPSRPSLELYVRDTAGQVQHSMWGVYLTEERLQRHASDNF